MQQFNSKILKSARGSKNNIKLRKLYIFLNRASQTCFRIKGRFTLQDSPDTVVALGLSSSIYF